MLDKVLVEDSLETGARYQPVSLPEFMLRSGSLKWSQNLKASHDNHKHNTLEESRHLAR